MSIVITLEVDDKGTAIVKKFSNETNKDLDKLSKKSGVFGKELGSSFNKVGDFAFKASMQIVKFATALATISVAAGAAGIALVTKEAGALEQKLDFVGAVLKDRTVPGMQDLSDLVLQLGRDTQWMSTQIAEGAEQLAKAGFSTQEVIGALPGTLSLATAGSIGLAEASQITANTLRAFGIEASEASKVADVLAFTATRTNTTVLTIGEAMKYIAPLARTAGMTLQETSAAIGLLGNVGISASMAGTTLRAVLSSLLSPTKEQSDLINELGLNVTTGEGKLVSLTEVIKQLEIAGATTSDILDLFGRRGGPGMAALLSFGSEALREFTIETENAGGTADEIAREKLNNFNGQVIILKSSIQGLMIALGAPFLEMFSDFIKLEVIPIINKMSFYVHENQESIIDFGKELVNFFRMAGESISDLISFMQTTGLPMLSTIFKLTGDIIGYASSMIVSFLDTLSLISTTFNKLPKSIKLLLPLKSVADAFDKISDKTKGFRDTIESLGVKSIYTGNVLAGLTTHITDLTYGLHESAIAVDDNKNKQDELEESTSTLAKTVSDGLIPSLIDTENEFEKTRNEIDSLMQTEDLLTNNTIEYVNTMKNDVDSLSNSWNNVDESIRNSNKSLNTFNQDLQLGEFGISQGQIELQGVSLQDFSKQFAELAKVSPFITASSFGIGGVRSFQHGGIVPGLPNQEIPAILHGGEKVIPSNQNVTQQPIVIQLVLNDKIIAEEIISLNERNIKGLSNLISPTKKNIRNYQEVGA